jgi:mono/diheme cytochrome c family protein
MKKALRVIGIVVVLIAVVLAGAYLWANTTAGSRYNHQWQAHQVDFPIPFPLSAAEMDSLRVERIAAGAPGADPLAGLDMDSVATAWAVRRGEHLVGTRLGCNGCHKDDFGGGVLVDVPIVGYWAAPNLTAGKGSVTQGYTASDWDHAVRHGIRRGGKTSSMPSVEYGNLSDHELSDVVSFVRSHPPVDRESNQVRLGPVFSFLLAGDPKQFFAYTIDHQKPHPVEPPGLESPLEAGEHIVQVCRGCHGPNLSGGKLQGDPNMPIVANLTPHETGLKSWTESDFLRAMHEGRRPDGSAISPMMPWQAYGRMSDAELLAVWSYLRTVPAVAKGVR